jgi:hypothetical protein
MILVEWIAVTLDNVFTVCGWRENGRKKFVPRGQELVVGRFK